jgi:hypothetical protein
MVGILPGRAQGLPMLDLYQYQKDKPLKIMMDHDTDAHVHCLVDVSAYSGANTHAKDDQIADYYL